MVPELIEGVGQRPRETKINATPFPNPSRVGKVLILGTARRETAVLIVVASEDI
jgi:hypothetical protein